jgi:hypothetical protein
MAAVNTGRGDSIQIDWDVPIKIDDSIGSYASTALLIEGS